MTICRLYSNSHVKFAYSHNDCPSDRYISVHLFLKTTITKQLPVFWYSIKHVFYIMSRKSQNIPYL